MATGTVTNETDDQRATIRIAGVLDGVAGETLRAQLCQVATTGITQVEVDLREVTDFTDDGAAALVACRGEAQCLDDGLLFRTAPGPGRDALLVAFADEAGDGEFA